jgi:hypothetical protein
VVAFPVNNRWKRHVRQIAQRDFERTCGQTQLGGRLTERFQARPVPRRVAQLPDPGQADGTPEVPANHAETCGPAIHFIDLLDVREMAQAPPPLAEQASLSEGVV